MDWEDPALKSGLEIFVKEFAFFPVDSYILSMSSSLLPSKTWLVD